MDEKKMENNTVVKPSGDGNEKTGLQALLTKRNIIIMALALIVAVVLLVVLTSSPSPKAVIGELKLGMKPEKVVELIGEPDKGFVNDDGEGRCYYESFAFLEEQGRLIIEFKNAKICDMTWESSKNKTDIEKESLVKTITEHILAIYGNPTNDYDSKWWKLGGKGDSEAFIYVGEPSTGSKDCIIIWIYNKHSLN